MSGKMPLNKNGKNPRLKFNPVLVLIGLGTTGIQTTRRGVFEPWQGKFWLNLSTNFI